MKKTLFIFLMICAGLYKVCGQTPVPVYEEPRHKPVFTNNYLRVIQARIMDKDTSLYHIHATPSCFVFVKPAIHHLLGHQQYTELQPDPMMKFLPTM
jgi:hypothetical protein